MRTKVTGAGGGPFDFVPQRGIAGILSGPFGSSDNVSDLLSRIKCEGNSSARPGRSNDLT